MNVLEAIQVRRSVRAYTSQPIPDEVMNHMREALWSAPSAGNHQPWHFIFVMDEALRWKLVEASFGQKMMASAPMIVVACGLPEEAYRHMGGYGNSVDVDVAIALDHLTLAAVAEGLGTCWIGKFNEAMVKPVLNIPADVKVVAMTPLGYPDSPERIRPMDPARRKAQDKIFSINTWS